MDKIFKFAAAALRTVEGAQLQHWESLIKQVYDVVSMPKGASTTVTAARFDEHGNQYRVDVVVTRE